MHARTRLPASTNEVMALAAELDSIAPIHRQKRLFIRMRESSFPWVAGRPDVDPELQLHDAFAAAFLLGATEPACAAAFAAHVAALFALAHAEPPAPFPSVLQQRHDTVHEPRAVGAVDDDARAVTLTHVVRRRLLIATTDWTEADARELELTESAAERMIYGAAEPVALLPEADIAWLRVRCGGASALVFLPLSDDASCERMDSSAGIEPGSRANGRLVLRGARLPRPGLFLAAEQPAFLRCVALRRACAQALTPAAWLGAAQRALEELRTHVLLGARHEARDELAASLGAWLLELRCAVAACLEALRFVARAAFDGGFVLRRARAVASAVHARAPLVAEHIVTRVRRRLGHAGLMQGHPLERMSREIRAATADGGGDATCALDAGRDFLRAGEGIAFERS